MRKSCIINIVFLLFAACVCAPVKGAVTPPDPCIDAIQNASNYDNSVRADILSIAQSKVGVSEATGNNDGAEVEEFQKATGNKKGDQWCASFVAWVYKKAGLHTIGNAYSPSWFTTETVIYKPSANLNSKPEAGDVFGVWVTSKKRVGHVGIIAAWNDEFVTTIEGNYSNKVVRQRRITRQIYVASNWVSHQSTI